MGLYSEKLLVLEKEFAGIAKKQRGKYSFKENQQKVYDFVMGRCSIVQFEVNGEQFFMNRGHKSTGFEHILVKHYGKDCEGAITARDILNISNVIKNGRELTDDELRQEEGNYEKKGYEQPKNGLKYKVIVRKERNGNWVISLFSNKKIIPQEEIISLSDNNEEKGDCS